MPKLLKQFSRVCDRMLKYGVAAILLVVPLYPKFPFLRIPGIQVSVRLEDFVIFSVILIWTIAILPKVRQLLKDKITQQILLFFFIGAVSIFFGAIVSETIAPHIGILHWGRRVEYLASFFIGASSIKKREDIYFYIKILLIVVVCAFVYGVGQKYFNVPVITTQNAQYAKGVALRYTPGAHLVSTFAGHYDLASFLILLFPTLYLFLFAKKETLKQFVPDTYALLTRLILITIVLFGLWLLTQTASRISLASYMGSSIFALMLMNKKKFIPLVILVSFIFAATSMNLINRYLNIVNVYAQEVGQNLPEELPSPTPQVVNEDRSTSIRLNVEWPRAIRALTKNPLTGTGYSSISLATDNDYLRMLGEIGIVGFVAFWAAFFNIMLTLLKKFPSPKSLAPEDIYVAGVFAAIPGVLLNMVFIDLLEASKFAICFWLMLGFAVGVVRLKEK